MSNIKIDPTKTGLENLLVMVDSLNTNGPTTPDEVTVSGLAAITPNGVLNTQVTLTGTNTGATHFTGSVTVEYGRLALADEVTSPSTHVAVPVATTDAPSLLHLAAQHYGFIEADISWVAAPTRPSSFPTDPVTTTPQVQCSGSLVYQDGQASVNLDWAAQTVLLMHFDGDVTDARGHSTLNSGNNVWAASTSGPVKFGTNALAVGSGGAEVQITDPGDLTFLGDFTMEGWVYLGSHGGYLWAKSSGANACYVQFDSTTTNLNVRTDNGTVHTVGTYGAITNQWNHVALTKSGTTWTVWINGASIGSFTSSDTFGNIATFWTIGNMDGSNSPIAANIDETRFSRVCRYTGAFTVPSAAFTLD